MCVIAIITYNFKTSIDVTVSETKLFKICSQFLFVCTQTRVSLRAQKAFSSLELIQCINRRF